MRAKMFFYFLKIIFDINTSKRSKTYKTYEILAKKKIEFFGNFPNGFQVGPTGASAPATHPRRPPLGVTMSKQFGFSRDSKPYS